MAMNVPLSLAPTVARWADLSRWERAELGRALRRLGWSYGEIRQVIPVPKGTLAGWCRDIRLTPDQAEAIRRRSGSQKGVPRDTQRKRREQVERIRWEARREVRHLIEEPLWIAGTCLYWAEGAKTQRMVILSNADPAALRLFIEWVTAYLDSSPEFVLGLHLHHGNDNLAAQRFWRTALQLPTSPFTKTHVKARGTGHRKNHLEHGICRVRLRRGADASIRIAAWIDALRLWDWIGGTARMPGGSLAQLARATGS